MMVEYLFLDFLVHEFRAQVGDEHTPRGVILFQIGQLQLHLSWRRTSHRGACYCIVRPWPWSSAVVCSVSIARLLVLAVLQPKTTCGQHPHPAPRTLLTCLDPLR